MAEPVRQKDHETYMSRANQARIEADAATLDNVRDRCLRAEAAWLEMAARAERTEKMRTTQLEAKAAQAALAEGLIRGGLRRLPDPERAFEPIGIVSKIGVNSGALQKPRPEAGCGRRSDGRPALLRPFELQPVAVVFDVDEHLPAGRR